MRSRRSGGTGLATAAAVIGCFLLAIAYPFTALRLNPIALPAVAIGAVLAAVSLQRIEVGIATALFLCAVPAGLAGGAAWLPGAAWVGLIVTIVVLRQAREDATRRLPPSSALVLVDLVVIIISFGRAQDTTAALPVMRSAVTGIALFYVIATQVRTRRQVVWTVSGFLAGALMIGGLATAQWATGAGSRIGFLTETGELVYRITGGMGQPNQLGGFLVVLIPLALATMSAWAPGRAVAAVVAVASLIGLYASYSRGALLALGVAVLLLLRTRTLVIALPVLVVLGVTLAPATLHERFATGESSGSELASRTDIWRTAVAVWEEDPLLGNGLGSFPSAYATSRAPGKNFLPNTLFEPPPHAHNVYLNLLAEQGLLGLVAFLAVLLSTVAHALHLRRSERPWVAWYGRAMLASMAAFAVHNLLDVTLGEQTGIYMWALFGLTSALAATESILSAPTPAPVDAPRVAMA